MKGIVSLQEPDTPARRKVGDSSFFYLGREWKCTNERMGSTGLGLGQLLMSTEPKESPESVL